MKEVRVLLILLALLVVVVRADQEIRCAFSTFIYTEDQDDVYGAVALGRSLLNTEANAERVAVIYGPHNPLANKILELSGWTIIDATTHYVFEHSIDDPSITTILSGNKGREALMAKFFVFTLTDYDVVVYLDNNVIVAANIDELCRCAHAQLGSVSLSRNHDIGVMTLVPSKEMFASLATAIHDGVINEPYDIFRYFYENNECPYYDPLLEDPDAMASERCIRLPARYNGDIAYHLLDGFIDNQLDKPKVLYYSLNGVQPWCWWNSILLPQYWIWSSSYMKTIDDARVSFDFSTLDWLIRLGISVVVFDIIPIVRATDPARLFGRFYINERHATTPFSKLLLFQFFNVLAVFFGCFWSDVYVSHPIMNIVLYVVTMDGIYNILLFSHTVDTSRRLRIRVCYYVGTFVFLTTFLSPFILPADFLLRLILINDYFFFVHAICFTFLFLANNRSNYSKHTDRKEQPQGGLAAFMGLLPLSLRPTQG